MLIGVALGAAAFQAAGGHTGSAWRPEDVHAMQLAVRAAAAVALFGAVAASLRGAEST
jgi:hypothetical protein